MASSPRPAGRNPGLGRSVPSRFQNQPQRWFPFGPRGQPARRGVCTQSRGQVRLELARPRPGADQASTSATLPTSVPWSQGFPTVPANWPPAAAALTSKVSQAPGPASREQVRGPGIHNWLWFHRWAHRWGRPAHGRRPVTARCTAAAKACGTVIDHAATLITILNAPAIMINEGRRSSNFGAQHTAARQTAVRTLAGA